MELSLTELKAFLGATPSLATRSDQNMGLQIAVLDRGWVFIGHCRWQDDMLVIENTSCIRRWGTTNGIGQLAREGKRPETVLDFSGIVHAPRRAVVALIECEASKWNP